jgi:putative FmdB family regulatory protein
MPTYTYSCKQCAHRFDKWQSFDEPTLETCPACQGKLRKILNSVGVVFKGSGFYRTDSRSGSAISAPSRPKNDGPKSGEKPSEKTASSPKKESNQPVGSAA